MYIFLFLVTFNIVAISFLSIGTAFAQETAKFIPLVGIPYIDTQSDDVTFGDFVNGLYYASISIAAFLAVVKIIFAGVKYMLSDVVTSKEDAKKDIKGALLGLLIVIGAVLVLNTINPSLSKINFFGEDSPIPGVGELGQAEKKMPTVNVGDSITVSDNNMGSDNVKGWITACKNDNGKIRIETSGDDKTKLTCAIDGLGDIPKDVIDTYLEKLMTERGWGKIIKEYDNAELRKAREAGVDPQDLEFQWETDCEGESGTPTGYSYEFINVGTNFQYYCVELK